MDEVNAVEDTQGAQRSQDDGSSMSSFSIWNFEAALSKTKVANTWSSFAQDQEKGGFFFPPVRSNMY